MPGFFPDSITHTCPPAGLGSIQESQRELLSLIAIQIDVGFIRKKKFFFIFATFIDTDTDIIVKFPVLRIVEDFYTERFIEQVNIHNGFRRYSVVCMVWAHGPKPGRFRLRRLSAGLVPVAPSQLFRWISGRYPRFHARPRRIRALISRY